jgi:hypothetical protein
MLINGLSESQIEAMHARVLQEIATATEALRQKDRELAALMADKSTRLGTILEVRANRLELLWYLKGLNFLQISKSEGTTDPISSDSCLSAIAGM